MYTVLCRRVHYPVSTRALSCVDSDTCFVDWTLCVFSTLSGLVCCSRVICLVAWCHTSIQVAWIRVLTCLLNPVGVMGWRNTHAVAFYLVLWWAVLCSFTCLNLGCLCLFTLGRGPALCSRLCTRVLPHLFVCSPVGLSGFFPEGCHSWAASREYLAALVPGPHPTFIFLGFISVGCLGLAGVALLVGCLFNPLRGCSLHHY